MVKLMKIKTILIIISALLAANSYARPQNGWVHKDPVNGELFCNTSSGDRPYGDYLGECSDSDVTCGVNAGDRCSVAGLPPTLNPTSSIGSISDQSSGASTLVSCDGSLGKTTCISFAASCLSSGGHYDGNGLNGVCSTDTGHSASSPGN